MFALTTNIEKLSFEKKPDYNTIRKYLRECIELSHRLEQILNPDKIVKYTPEESKHSESTNVSSPKNN